MMRATELKTFANDDFHPTPFSRIQMPGLTAVQQMKGIPANYSL
jgi:hypothetical protein